MTAVLEQAVRALALAGPIVVGMVFVVTAGPKAVAPSRTRRHLQLLGLPSRWIVPVATLMPIGEGALGAALVAGLAPAVVLPVAIGLLAVLSGLTIWSTGTGRTDDCGCYGGLVQVQPGVSVLLNVGYATLLAIAWWVSDAPAGLWPGAVVWKAAVVMAAAALAGGVTALANRRIRVHGRDLVDLRPLRPGRPWDRRWLGPHNDVLQAGEYIVVFLGRSCPACKRWLRPLKVIHARGDLPSVVGVMAATAQEVTEFVAEHTLTFPVLPIAPATAGRLIDSVPTVAVVDGGVVRSVDTAQLPPALVARLRRPAPALSTLAGQALADRLPAPPAEVDRVG